jgi:hypothetical protein
MSICSDEEVQLGVNWISQGEQYRASQPAQLLAWHHPPHHPEDGNSPFLPLQIQDLVYARCKLLDGKNPPATDGWRMARSSWRLYSPQSQQSLNQADINHEFEICNTMTQPWSYVDGFLYNMFHSIIQQAARQNLADYALMVVARPDYHRRLPPPSPSPLSPAKALASSYFYQPWHHIQ